MSQFTGVKCDCCGKIKGDTNRWFKVVPFASGGQIGVFRADYEIILIEQDKPRVLDLCGEACVGKKLSELLPGLHS